MVARSGWVYYRGIATGLFLCIVFELHVHITYLLTPWSRVLLEKLASLQLVKKFPVCYGTRRFLTALTSARHHMYILKL